MKTALRRRSEKGTGNVSEYRGVARRMQGVSLSLIRQVFEKAPPGAINLGLGEPAFQTAPEILATAHQALDGGRLGYTFNGGMPELRALVAERSPGDRGPESVCVTVGANGGLLGSMLASVDAGDEVLVPDPGFPTYEALATLAGATPVRYRMKPENGFRFEAAALQELVRPSTRAIVINTPSNPTGHVIARDELEALARIAQDNDLTVISDEVYQHFYYGEPAPSYADVSDRGLVVNSLSKTEAMTVIEIGGNRHQPAFRHVRSGAGTARRPDGIGTGLHREGGANARRLRPPPGHHARRHRSRARPAVHRTRRRVLRHGGGGAARQQPGGGARHTSSDRRHHGTGRRFRRSGGAVPEAVICRQRGRHRGRNPPHLGASVNSGRVGSRNFASPVRVADRR